MQTQQKEPTAHWSTHPWKLSIILAVTLAVLSAAYLLLMQVIVSRPFEEPSRSMTWYLLPQLLLLACFVLLAVVVLRAQAKHGLADRTLNRMGWAAVPGFAVAVIVLVFQLLQYSGENQNIYLRNNLSSALGGIASTSLPVLLAAMLLPVLRPQMRLVPSALIVVAIQLAFELGKYAVVIIMSPLTGLWPSAVLASLHPLTYGLVASMFFIAVRRRLWDALALQWALFFLFGWLSHLWGVGMGASLQLWQVYIANLTPWLLLALASLYCLIMWDRGASPGDPFKAIARRIRALAGHFLPT